MEFTVLPKSDASSSDSANNIALPAFLPMKRASFSGDILEGGAGASPPLRPAAQAHSVRFNVGSVSEWEDEKIDYSTRFDVGDTKPLELNISSDSESESSAEVSTGVDSGAYVSENTRPNSPDLAFGGEVTVYYDTVAMNPEWENLDELEVDDNAEPAADTLPQDLLKPSVESAAQPTILIDHTEATLHVVRDTLPSAAECPPPSPPHVPELDTPENFITHVHDDSVAEESGDITAHNLVSPVDYDADTSSWFPGDKNRYYFDSESNDENDSSDDECAFDMVEPAANDAHHKVHTHATEQVPEEASPICTSGDTNDIATLAVSAEELFETPVVEAAAQSLMDFGAQDAAHVGTTAFTGQKDTRTGPVPVPAGSAAPRCAEEVLEAPVADNTESVLPSATEKFTIALEDSAPAQSEENKGPSIALYRAISVYSGAVAGIIDPEAADTIAPSEAPAGVAGEIVTSDCEVITATANNSADAAVVASPTLAPTVPPSNLSEALKAEPSTFSETVVEAVEPMSLAAILGLWIQSILYVKVVSLFLSSIYSTIEYIEGIVFAGLLSVAFFVTLVIGLILAIVPFMGFTGVISVVGILLGCFHVCATSGNKYITSPAYHGIASAQTPQELD